MKTPQLIAGLLIVLTAMLTANALAAPKGDNAGRLARGLDVINTALAAVTDLSDAQKTSTKAILADAEAQIVALRDEAKSKGKDAPQAERQAMRQKVQEIAMAARAEVEAELTDAQKQAFREAFKAARQEAAAKRGEKQPGKGKKDQPV